MQDKKTVKTLLDITAENIKKIKDGEIISVEDSLGRIISEDIIPQNEVPPFIRSAVDGFAVISSDFLEKKNK